MIQISEQDELIWRALLVRAGACLPHCAKRYGLGLGWKGQITDVRTQVSGIRQGSLPQAARRATLAGAGEANRRDPGGWKLQTVNVRDFCLKLDS